MVAAGLSAAAAEAVNAAGPGVAAYIPPRKRCEGAGAEPDPAALPTPSPVLSYEMVGRIPTHLYSVTCHLCLEAGGAARQRCFFQSAPACQEHIRKFHPEHIQVEKQVKKKGRR